MSGLLKSWFHCGRCGALFESEPGEQPDRRCAHCGFDPSLGARTVPGPEAASPVPSSTAKTVIPERAEPRKHSRKSRKPKNRHVLPLLLLGWSLLLALIVVGARFLWGDPNESSRPAAPAAAAATRTSEEDNALLAKASPLCSQALSAFLAAGGPESQSQFVLHPVETVSRMTRFHSLNPIPKVDPEALEPVGQSIFRIGDTPVVEMVLQSGSGERYDIAFREADEQWRIDWNAYIRFSEYPFPLFLAGSGPDEAEFRLLARERLAGERGGEDTLSLIFYAPRFGKPGDVGAPSPEFLVPRDSDDGRLLAAGFAAAAKGARPFGATLDPGDPDGMIRVRVRLRRITGEENRRFEVAAVRACHWYDSDEPGVGTVGR